MKALRDERGVLLSWFAKIIVGLAIMAVVAYDSGSVIVNYFGLDSAADAVAVSVATRITDGSLTSPIAIRQAAVTLARHEKARVVGARLGADDVFHLRLRRTAHTLVVERFSPISKWGTATAAARSSAR